MPLEEALAEELEEAADAAAGSYVEEIEHRGGTGAAGEAVASGQPSYRLQEAPQEETATTEGSGQPAAPSASGQDHRADSPQEQDAAATQQDAAGGEQHSHEHDQGPDVPVHQPEQPPGEHILHLCACKPSYRDSCQAGTLVLSFMPISVHPGFDNSSLLPSTPLILETILNAATDNVKDLSNLIQQLGSQHIPFLRVQSSTYSHLMLP